MKLYKANRYSDALAAFEAAAALRPDEAEAQYGRGVSLAHMGGERYEEALGAFKLALSLRPDLRKAYSALGVVLGLLGRNEEALRAFDHALELRPDEPSSHVDRGMTLAVLGRYEEAFAALDQAAAFGVENEAVLGTRALLLKRLLRGLGVTGGKRAWLGSGPIGAKQPLILQPGAPTVSQAVIEDRG